VPLDPICLPEPVACRLINSIYSISQWNDDDDDDGIFNAAGRAHAAAETFIVTSTCTTAGRGYFAVIQ